MPGKEGPDEGGGAEGLGGQVHVAVADAGFAAGPGMAFPLQRVENDFGAGTAARIGFAHDRPVLLEHRRLPAAFMLDPNPDSFAHGTVDAWIKSL